MSSKITRLQPSMVTDRPSTIKPDMATMSVAEIQTIGSSLGIPGARQYRKKDIHHLKDSILGTKLGAKKYMDSSKAARDDVIRAYAAESQRSQAASHARFVSAMADIHAEDELLADASRAAIRHAKIPRGYIIQKESLPRAGILFSHLSRPEQIAYVEIAAVILKAVAHYLEVVGVHDPRVDEAGELTRAIKKLIEKNEKIRSTTVHESLDLDAIHKELKRNAALIKQLLHDLSLHVSALIETYFEPSSETGGGVAAASAR